MHRVCQKKRVIPSLFSPPNPTMAAVRVRAATATTLVVDRCCGGGGIRAPTQSCCLLFIIVIQWILLVGLLHRQQQLLLPNGHHSSLSSSAVWSQPSGSTTACREQEENNNDDDKSARRTIVPPTVPLDRIPFRQDTTTTTSHSTSTTSTTTTEGVAATLLFRAPHWFHLRYTAMIQNALVNLPPLWKIQVVYHGDFFHQTVLAWHPTIRSWYEQGHDRIVFTPIPNDLQQLLQQQFGRLKPKHITSSRWFWEALLAEQVLLFTGNGAFCSNHFDPSVSLDLATVDYLGTPWTQHYGHGGDGSTHSFRRRSVMLRILDHATQHQLTLGTKTAEHLWTLQVVDHMNRHSHKDNSSSAGPPVRLATPAQTHVWGGVTNLTTNSNHHDKKGQLQHIPRIVSGTLAHLKWADRETLLQHCPEAKLVFPSLHEPACFGAHPNPDTCQASICALQDHIPSSGC